MNQCATYKFEFLTYTDVIKAKDIVVPRQVFAYVQPGAPSTDDTQNIITEPGPDGRIGFGRATSTFSSKFGGSSFYNALNEQGRLEFRFGLALEIDGTGSLILGGLDSDMTENDFDTISIIQQSTEWEVMGTVHVGSTTIPNQKLIIDSSVEGVSSVNNQRHSRNY